MNFFTKTMIKLHTLRWLLTWKKRNNHYPVPVKDNPKFMTPWDAAGIIPEGAVVGTSGLGGNQRCQAMYWAMRERFKTEGTPRDLTVVSVGGQGGRGKIPGTLEELAVKGLISRFITGHSETFRAQLKMADAGDLEVQILPQGTLTLLLRAQGEGKDYVINKAGVGTFLDPRTGRGTPLVPVDAEQLVEVQEDGQFKYRIPPVNAAVFSAPAADRKGNIYIKNCAVLCESLEIARAARRNGGKVIVNVGRIVKEGYDEIAIPAEDVDAVVYWPGTEQSATIKHRKHWDCLTLDSRKTEKEGLARIKVINDMLKVTPRRRPVDNVLSRLATYIFVQNARKGDHVDIGVGLPEEVSRLLYENGVLKDLTMINESGVIGGVAAPGVFFGAAVNPTEIVSSAEAFSRIYERLDWAILGALQVDSSGNVNVSKRGEAAANYVGPGGFIDLITNAKCLMFATSWGDRARFEVSEEGVTVTDKGRPKFIDNVDEITFNGEEALKNGQKVFYVTHTGAFQLTDKGMELIYIMPGIDLQKDILDASDMRIVLPESGAPEVVPDFVMTGEGFTMELPE